MSDATITCPACGDAHESPDGDASFMALNIVRCDACQARIVYGEIAPRVVIEPVTVSTAAGQRDFMRLLIQDQKTKATLFDGNIDPQHAFMIAQTIIAMVRP